MQPELLDLFPPTPADSSTPPLRSTAPLHDTTAAPLRTSAPPIRASSPPLRASSPLFRFRASAPPLRATAAPVRASAPPLRGSSAPPPLSVARAPAPPLRASSSAPLSVARAPSPPLRASSSAPLSVARAPPTTRSRRLAMLSLLFPKPAAFVGAQLDPLKSPTIIPPYPWALPQRAKILIRGPLISSINEIVQLQMKCLNCKHHFVMTLDFIKKTRELLLFFLANRNYLHDETQEVVAYWLSPGQEICPMCNTEGILVPINAPKKREINWLGLTLASELGGLNCDQLGYFCKHNGVEWRNCSKVKLVTNVVKLLFRQLFNLQ